MSAAPDKTALVAAFDRAIAAARDRIGATRPNPPVGCAVLSATGEVIAVAAHRRAGEPHAEPLALAACRAAGRIDEADTLVVTLEPCDTTGRTPPCTRAILTSPVRSIWIGALDPNLRPGAGVAALRAGGRVVRLLDGESDGDFFARVRTDCADLIRGFALRVRTGRPWVVVKQALDPAGSMIPPPGRTTFTSPRSLRLAHRLRREADAIVTGSGTILADRPHFTVRHLRDHDDAPARQLLILDRRRRVPADYLAAAAARGFRVAVLDDVEDALDRAGRDGASIVLVEAGPQLTADILSRGLWNEHVVIRKPDWTEASDAIERRFAGAGGRGG